MRNLKQALVIDTELGMSTGKMIAQASHGSLNAYIKADEEIRKEWLDGGGKKIVLKKGSASFDEMAEQAERLNIPYEKVVDAGLTEVPSGTETAICLGPEEEAKIDKITSELELVE